jgi:hypothetical protein
MINSSPSINLAGMGVNHHACRRKANTRHNHPSSDSHSSALHASKDEKDANNKFVVAVHLTRCKVRVPRHRENK